MIGLRYTTGITIDNPMETNAPFIKVKIHDTDQEIEAVYHSPLSLDRRAERPNVEVGTEIGLLFDNIDTFYVLGATQQGITPSGDKARRFKNNDMFEVQSKKLKIHNDTAELITLISDFMGTVSSMKADVTGGSSSGKWAHDKASDITALKKKLDSFKA